LRGNEGASNTKSGHLEPKVVNTTYPTSALGRGVLAPGFTLHSAPGQRVSLRYLRGQSVAAGIRSALEELQTKKEAK